MSVTWMPLSAAYAHVLRCEQHPRPAELRLRAALSSGRLQSRATCCLLPSANPEFNLRPEERERTDVVLQPDFWCGEVVRLGEELYSLPEVSWLESRATTRSDHPLGPIEAYQIEIDQDQLFALWPEQEPALPASAAGRPPKYDVEAILTEAAAYVVMNDPQTLVELMDGVKAKLGSRAPKPTRLKELLGPFFKRMQDELGR